MQSTLILDKNSVRIVTKIIYHIKAGKGNVEVYKVIKRFKKVLVANRGEIAIRVF